MVDAQRSRSTVLARLGALSSTVLALGAVGHVAGTGTLPDGRTTAAVALLTVAAGVPLARRRLRVTTLLPAAAVGQWLLHHAFAATAPGVAHAPVTGHVHPGGTPAPGGDHGTAAAMLAAHVLATALTVALLVATERGAERALHRCAWALPVLTGARTLVAAVTVRPGLVLVRVPAPVTPARTRGAHGRRAPPPEACAA